VSTPSAVASQTTGSQFDPFQALNQLGSRFAPALTPNAGAQLTIANGVKVQVLRVAGQPVKVTLPNGSVISFGPTATNDALVKSNLLREKLNLPLYRPALNTTKPNPNHTPALMPLQALSSKLAAITQPQVGAQLTIYGGVSVQVLREKGKPTYVTLSDGTRLAFKGNTSNEALIKSNLLREKLNLPFWAPSKPAPVKFAEKLNKSLELPTGDPLTIGTSKVLVSRKPDATRVYLENGKVLEFAPNVTNKKIAESGITRKALGIAEAAKGKPGFNPAATVVYSVSGALASYKNLRASGLTHQQAILQLPAGFIRDIFNIGLSELPLNSIKDAKIEWVAKSTVGGILTLTTNAASNEALKRLYPPGVLKPSLNVGIILAAGTVNGGIIGLRELQKNGYLWGLPPDNPKDAKEWFHKYGLSSLAIGVGVTTAITPALVVQRQLDILARPADSCSCDAWANSDCGRHDAGLSNSAGSDREWACGHRLVQGAISPRRQDSSRHCNQFQRSRRIHRRRQSLSTGCEKWAQ
jgi:hypothetical protein